MYQNLVVFCFVFALINCSKDSEERLAAAEVAIAAGEYRTAVIELKNLLKFDPRHINGRVLLGDVYHRSGDYLNAVKEYEKALDAGGNKENVENKLFRVMVRVGDHEEVLEVLESRDDLSPVLLTRLGEASYYADNLDFAEQNFTAALNRDPEIVDAYTGRARLAWGQLDYVSARSFANQAHYRDDKNFEPLLLLAEISLAKNEYEAAKQYYNSILPLSGGTLSARIGLVRTALIAEDLAAAGEQIQPLEKLAENHPMVLYLGGLIDFQNDRIQDAEGKLTGVLKYDPNSVPALVLLGTIKFRQGQSAQAGEYLNRAVVLNPGNHDVVKMLASIRLNQGDLDGAESLLKPIASESGDPQLLVLYANLLEKRNDSVAAGKMLSKAVNLAPDVAKLRTQLAVNLLSSGEFDSAANELKTAIELDQNLFESDRLLVMVKLHQKELKEAERLVNDLIAKSPESASAFYLLAQVRRAQKDDELRQWALERAFDFDPNFYPAYNELVALNKGNGAALVSLAERALAHNPQHLEARMSAASVAFNQGKLEDGERHLQRAVIGNADDIRPRLALARYYLAQKKVRSADEMAEDAFKIAPESLETMLVLARVRYAQGRKPESRELVSNIEQSLVPNVPQAYIHRLADVQSVVGLDHLAIDHFYDLLKGDDYPGTYRARLRLVRLELRRSKISEARVQFDQLGATQANLLGRQKLEADLLLAERRYPEAETILRSLGDGEDRDSTIKLAMLLARTERLDEAHVTLSLWLIDHQGDVGALMLVADIELKKDRTDKAVVLYENILQLDKNNVVALNNIAWIYLDTNLVKALSAAQKAFHISPQNPDVLDTLGWVYLKNNQVADSLEYLLKAQKLGGDNPTIAYHLAVVYQKQGENALAKEQLKTALAAGAFAERQSAEALLLRI